MKTPMKTHHRLLLTGAAGGLGTALRERLKASTDAAELHGMIAGWQSTQTA